MDEAALHDDNFSTRNIRVVQLEADDDVISVVYDQTRSVRPRCQFCARTHDTNAVGSRVVDRLRKVETRRIHERNPDAGRGYRHCAS